MLHTTPTQLMSNRVPAAHYSVVIIGAGINGAGTFRDLSAQGVDCLMIDSGDFCAGASAAPSRLIHGGIKYLENGEFGLVRQSTLERNLLLKNAPHYVRPIETVLPIRSWFGGTLTSAIRFFGGKVRLTDRGVLITKLGLELFDFFGSTHRVMPRHSLRFRAATRREFPDIAQDVVATATYYDARVTYAERLGLELALDGMNANPRSLAINYMRLAGCEGASLHLQDAISGNRVNVTADIVINAAGAWIDKVNTCLGLPTRYMGGNKGSHLILHNTKLHDALKGRMIYFGAADGRVGLMYPFMGQVLVGSTDIPIDDPDLAVCEIAERDYMLATLKEVFPHLSIAAEDVVYTYCGVRPLPRSDASDPGAVSRDHSIRIDHLPGTTVPVHSLIGGKWTTFRGFAEEAADHVLRFIRMPRKASTQLLAIGGGRNYPVDAASRAAFLRKLQSGGPSSARAELLLDRYGTRAEDVAKWCSGTADAPLASLPDYSQGELDFIFCHEMVATLDDVLFRRTDIALSGRLTPDVIREVAAIGAKSQNWNETRLQAEIATTIDLARSRHGLVF